MSLKAFYCESTWGSAEEDRQTTIIFREDSFIARRDFANAIGDDEDSRYIKITHYPEFDMYHKQGYIPSFTLFNSGWTLNCYECGTEVSQQAVDDFEFEYERDQKLSHLEPARTFEQLAEDGFYWIEPHFEGKHIFCSMKCFDSYWERKNKNDNLGTLPSP